MVPASLRIRRDEPMKAKPKARAPQVGAGFGLAPVSRPTAVVAPVPVATASVSTSQPTSTDVKFLEFMQTMNDLGAFE